MAKVIGYRNSCFFEKHIINPDAWPKSYTETWIRFKRHIDHKISIKGVGPTPFINAIRYACPVEPSVLNHKMIVGTIGQFYLAPILFLVFSRSRSFIL